jgi:hypothetical protein
MPREYHWIMTLWWPVPGGYGVGTADGIVAGGQGTRMEYFRELRKDAAAAIDAPDTARVLHFSIEPERQL